jgi:hypothetical protein
MAPFHTYNPLAGTEYRHPGGGAMALPNVMIGAEGKEYVAIDCRDLIPGHDPG